jgi:putative ABC transport system ATP-binding protein
MKDSAYLMSENLYRDAAASDSEQAMAWALRASAISKVVVTSAGALTILHPMDLAVARGETLAIVGPSGSGKSTLLALLAGLDSASSGEIESAQGSLSKLSEDQRAAWRARHVGFVFQQFQLLPAFTALENILLPLELAGLPRAQAQRRALQILDRVGLAARAQHYPRQLSGGEQQRIALARACVNQPTLLFADEPTGSLDSSTGSQIADLLFAMNRDLGTTLILVTHDATLAARCQRRVSLQQGQLQGGVAR